MACVDTDILVQPIPGGDPAGVPVPYLVRTQLEEARRPADESAAVDDPTASSRRVDWPTITRLTQDILAHQSKDLLTAARLTEALTAQHGFPGLTEGLTLLRRLLHEAWDRLVPAIEDGDLEVRGAPFNWLSEADRGARFPVTVRSLPLIASQGTNCSWLAWKRGQEGRVDNGRELFDQAVQQLSRKEAFLATQEIGQALVACTALVEELNEKLGEAAPSMEGLSLALNECAGLAQHILTLKGGPPDDGGLVEAGVDAGHTGVQDDAAMPREGGRMASANDIRRAVLARSEAYRRLTEVGEQLRILEPHSPVPFLIRKAIAWGSLPFPQLLRTLAREEGLMNMLSREEEETETEADVFQES